jgi:hypothetical protein
MQKPRFILLCILLNLVVFHGQCFAQRVIELDEKDNNFISSDFYRVVKDCDLQLQPYEIKSAPTARERGGASFGCKGYWLEFSVKNTTSHDRSWYIELPDPHIDFVAFYQDSTLVGKSGYLLPFEERSYKHKNHQFNILLKAGETGSYLLKLNPHYDIGFPFLIRSDQFTLAYIQQEYWLLGIYYGIILIMALYNFFVYFSVKEKTYLYYVLYAFSCAFISFSEDGIGFQFLWPELPYINYLIGIFSPVLLLLSFVLYANSFLQIRNRFPKNLNLALGSVVVYVLFIAATKLVGYNDKFRVVLMLIPFCLVFLSAVKIYRNGYIPARYFMLGCSFIILSLFVFTLRIFNLVPINAFTIYSFNIGFLLEVVVLSYALGERLRLEKAEKELRQKDAMSQLVENQKLKDSINRELEIRIDERTKELKSSNQKLEETKYEIERAYTKLEQQASEIARMNQMLNADNKELKGNVKELSKARVMFKQVNFEEFSKIYPDEGSCLKYLSEIKWAQKYKCRKCEGESFSEGRMAYSRRCTKCGYDESATAFTIFHRNRLPLNKAFYMVFLVSTSKKEISSEELSRVLELRQKSCWAFKQKIVEAINASNTKKFNPENWGTLFLIH